MEEANESLEKPSKCSRLTEQLLRELNYYHRTHKMRSQTFHLTDESKYILLKRIYDSPGIRYSELRRATGFANGVLAYHLLVLEKSRRIKVNRYHKRKSTRYYPVNTTAEESRILEYLRRPTPRKILLFLFEHDRCTYNDIMQHTKKVRSTISWHLSWLRKAGLISVRKKVNKTYRLSNKDLVAILMNKNQNLGPSS
jgi:predicted transcriptional regulator